MTVEEIAERLMAREQRVSVAEADTCGFVGYLLSTVPGSSKFFPGGVIAYTGGLKQSVLNVPDNVYRGRSGLPIGTFYLGLAGPGELEVAERIQTDAGDRDGNKRQAAQAVLDLLGRHVG
jgi:nicotinamide mononucleotide (NMN) deamidase PncC